MIDHVTFERAVYIEAELKANTEELDRYLTTAVDDVLHGKKGELYKVFMLRDAFYHTRKAADAAAKLCDLLGDQV